MQGKLRFFDSNCVLGSSQRQLPETRLSYEQVRRVFRHCGVERALVVHAHALELNPAEGNRRLAEFCRDRPELVPCFVLLPHHTGEMPAGDELLHLLRRGGARAARLCPARHRFRLDELWSGELLATLEEARLPVLLAAAEVTYEELGRVLAAHRGLPIVLLRPWYRDARLLYPLLERFENLYVEISYYQPFRGLEDLANRFGWGRLVYGSNFPEHDPCSTAAAVRWLDLPDEALQAIAWKNLHDLLAGTEIGS